MSEGSQENAWQEQPQQGDAGRTLRCGSTAQPMRMEICCTILMPVWRACQLFLLWHTALRKGSSAGMPSAEATTLNARAVVLRTYLQGTSRRGSRAVLGPARHDVYAQAPCCNLTVQVLSSSGLAALVRAANTTRHTARRKGHTATCMPGTICRCYKHSKSHASPAHILGAALGATLGAENKQVHIERSYAGDYTPYPLGSVHMSP